MVSCAFQKIRGAPRGYSFLEADACLAPLFSRVILAPCFSPVAKDVFWQHRIRSRYDLERDLADMGMTRTDAFNETPKPFREP